VEHTDTDTEFMPITQPESPPSPSLRPESQDTSASNPSQSRIREADVDVETGDADYNRLKECIICEADDMGCQCQHELAIAASLNFDIFNPSHIDKNFEELFGPTAQPSSKQTDNNQALDNLL
jgi:hypothetical protein